MPAFLAPIDPERLAGGLSAVVVAAVALTLLAGGGGRQSAVTPSAPPIVRPTPAAGSSGLSGVGSVAPSVRVPAGLATLVDTNVDILRAREDLVNETTAANPDAGTIARTLRMLNPLLTAADAQARTIAWGESPSPAQELAGIYEAAHDASTATLRASLTSGDAYVTGAAEVVALLEPLGPVTADLARRAGVPVPPEASAEAPLAP